MSTEDTAAAGPVRVLVVDDDPDIRFLLRHLLERHGWAVVGEADDGSEAVGLAKQHQPEVVLLDLLMSTPGQEVLPELLRIAPVSMVAVVSGVDPREYRQRLLELGAFSFYGKRRLEELPVRLERDLIEFRSMLDGYETVPPWLRDPAVGRHPA